MKPKKHCTRNERVKERRLDAVWHGWRCASAGNPHRKMAEPTHECRSNARRLAHDFNHLETTQNLFPENLQLQFGKSVADAAVDAEAKGQMLPRPLTVHDESVRLRNRRFIP